ncbi:MAG TPA: hypothetical protein VGH28_33755 [Polyangiaceae bacterium]
MTFPGEVAVLANDAGGLELRTPDALVRRIPSRERDALTKPMEHALRTATGLDLFYGPNPLEPITDARSYAFHVPVDPKVPAVDVSGVVAPAGNHAAAAVGPARESRGRECSQAGCLVGAWARLGWSS